MECQVGRGRDGVEWRHVSLLDETAAHGGRENTSWGPSGRKWDEFKGTENSCGAEHGCVGFNWIDNET